MFEEAQLYAPVTEGPDGVQVHLADDHPGANDPEYRKRRDYIAEERSTTGLHRDNTRAPRR